MTDNDKKLIEQAENMSRYGWREVDRLIDKADTAEARERLHNIKWDLYDSAMETL